MGMGVVVTIIAVVVEMGRGGGCHCVTGCA